MFSLCEIFGKMSVIPSGDITIIAGALGKVQVKDAAQKWQRAIIIQTDGKFPFLY